MQVLIDIPETSRPAIAFVRGKFNEGKPAQIVVGQTQTGTVQTGTTPVLDANGNPVLDANGVPETTPVMSPVYAPVMGPNPEYIASEEDYIIHVVNKAIDSYAAQAMVPTPPPAPSPTVINGVPQEVTRRQAIQALINKGKYDSVQPAIDAITDPVQKQTFQNEWTNSQTFQRQRPALITLGTAIGFTTTDLDNLFIYAATL